MDQPPFLARHRWVAGQRPLADVPDSTGAAPRVRITPISEIEAVEQRRLEQDVRRALPSGELLVNYQPRVALDTGATIGAEALARWRHRRRGMVPPANFIPVAERCGVITDIGGWVLTAACTEAAGWPGSAMVSVNVSAVQLAEGALSAQVARALDASNLPPERLELELTESMLVDAGVETLLTLSALRDRGIGIALDDFGTGYAGLATLKRLPLTALKLDRSLMHGLPHEPEDAGIVRAIVQMGRVMSLVVVAEGVETAAQRNFLIDLGCDEGQSYLFGRPMPGAQLRARLQTEAGGNAAVNDPATAPCDDQTSAFLGIPSCKQ